MMLIITISGLLVLCSFLLYKEGTVTAYSEQVLYNYNSRGSINYFVSLKPNSLYNNKNISEGNVYISSYIDNIIAAFNYELQGEKDTNIKGNYKVLAVIEGYSDDKNNTKTIWKKEFELLPIQNIDTYGKTFSISKEMPIKFDEYNNFASKIIEESKITVPIKLTVSMFINLKIGTNNESVEKTISPSIVIPLNTPFFEITKLNVDEKPETIQIIKKVPRTADKSLIGMLAASVIILISALIYIMFFTVPIIRNDVQEKKINKIFKEYGNRLVALNGEERNNYKSKFDVKSIEDLVKIADELSKPIFYKYSFDKKEISKFYITENEQLYEYDLLCDLELSHKNIFNYEQLNEHIKSS